MNELINITEKDGEHLLNARDLHNALDVGRDFSSWIKGRIEKYEFVENKDYFCSPNLGSKNCESENFCSPDLASKKGENRGGHNKIEYFLTLTMAKELAMVEDNEKGRAVRRYLISVEDKFKEMVVSGSLPVSAELNDRLTRIESMLEELKAGQKQISTSNIQDITEPKSAMLHFGAKHLLVTGKDSDFVEVDVLFKFFRSIYTVDVDSRKFMYEFPLLFVDVRLDTSRKNKALFRGCMLK